MSQGPDQRYVKEIGPGRPRASGETPAQPPNPPKARRREPDTLPGADPGHQGQGTPQPRPHTPPCAAASGPQEGRPPSASSSEPNGRPNTHQRPASQRGPNDEALPTSSLGLTLASSGGFTGTFLLCKAKQTRPGVQKNLTQTARLPAREQLPIQGSAGLVGRHPVNHGGPAWAATLGPPTPSDTELKQCATCPQPRGRGWKRTGDTAPRPQGSAGNSQRVRTPAPTSLGGPGPRARHPLRPARACVPAPCRSGDGSLAAQLRSEGGAPALVSQALLCFLRNFKIMVPALWKVPLLFRGGPH